MRLLWVALLGAVLVHGNVIIRHGRSSTPEEANKEMAAAVEGGQNKPPLHEWLTEEQKAVLEPLRSDVKQFKSKVLEFYSKLDGEKKEKWDAIYKEECDRWLKKVTSDEEYFELQALLRTDQTAADAKHKEYFERLSQEEKDKVNLWKDTCDDLTKKRTRRHLTSEEKEWLSWMDEEKRGAIEKMHDANEDEAVIHDKIKSYFKELPAEKQSELRTQFKKKCSSWIDEVASAEEQSALKTAYDNEDMADVRSRVEELFQKLSSDRQKQLKKFKGLCTRLWKLEESRLRRELDSNFADFAAWMTDDQKMVIGEMKNAGSSMAEIRAKTLEFFSALPADKQAELKQGFQGKCKAYFSKIATAEEMASMKTLHEAGNDDEVKTKLSDIIGRQSDDVKAVAAKMQMICADAFASSKKRRDIDTKIEKHLSWLTAEQKEEVKKMHASGLSKQDIRAKIFEFMGSMEPEKVKAAKEELRKDCYKWLEEAATKEEIAELHKLHETDHGACKTKVREYIERLPEARKEDVKKNLKFCEKVWYGEHDHSKHEGHGHGHKGHAHHHRRRRHLHAIEKYIDWLSAEQKKTVQDMEKNGEDFDSIVAKIKEFYIAESDSSRDKLKLKFKGQCAAWVKEVATPEELAELKELHKEDNTEKVKEMLATLENRLSEEQKHTVEHVRDVCFSVWQVKGASRRRREHAHTMEEAIEKFLTWTTDAQREELKSLVKPGDEDEEAIHKKIMEFYEGTTGETKTKATEELKGACKHYATDIFGAEKVAEIKTLKESGATPEDIKKKIDDLVEKIDDEKKKAKAQKLSLGCKKVYAAASRKRRDHHHTLEEGFGKYLTWTTEEQKDELRKLETAGEKEALYKKIMEFFESTTGETKTKAAEELKGACKHYATDIFGAEKVAEIKTLKESGATHEDMQKKIDELIEQIDDEKKKAKAQKLSLGCKKVYAAASRKRRDHHHTLEEGFGKYLTWTTEEQKDELRKLETAGEKEALYKKIMEFFESTTGETKTKAAEELKGACKHYATDIFGAEKVAEIKTLKESGATHEDMQKKIDELIEQIDDEKKKAKAQKLSLGCKKVYAAASRKRRDHHHTLEDGFGKYLTWTTEEQKDELRKLETAGEKEALYKKIMEFFESTTGETKTKAAEELKGACKHYATDIFGAEKVAEIKTLKESGATHEDMQKKIDELIEQIDDEKKKAKAQKLSLGCKKVYAAASRKRRDHHHTLEEGFGKYLTWTTEEQKDELRKLETAGEKEALYKKIMEFFESTTGETKTKAAEELKGACKHYATDIFGAEKVAEIKTLKESGATHEDMQKKIDELIEQIDDEKKKAKAQKLSLGCKKVYAAASRKRRDHHHTLEEGFGKYLTWTTEEQKDELRKLETAGEKEALYKKIMEFFESTTGETKTKAAEELKGACKHYATDIFGAEKVAEIKTLKESGATHEDMQKKIDELIEQIDDEKKKAKAQKLTQGCHKIYAAASRKRRDHHHTLEEGFGKYLTWTTEEQKDELRKLETAGEKEALYKKIMEFFESTTGETKTKAAEELKGACKHYATDIFGAEKVAEIKTLKESGATHEDMQKKIDELIEQIDDEKKKAKAQKLSLGCKKVYAAASRKRRDHHHTLEEGFGKYLTWTTEEQKDELRKLETAGEKEALYKKIMEFFESTTGETKTKAAEELKGACKHYATDIFGAEKVAEIKTLKESGATHEDMQKKIDELIEQIDDEKKKAKAQKLSLGCKKVYAAASRKRRDHHHTLEEGFGKYLTWTTEEQKDELRKLETAGEKEALYKKIMEFFESTTGETKTKAAEELKGACKHYATDIFGAEKVAEIKTLKESGATHEDMQKKIDELIEQIDDEKKKAKAQKLSLGCKKVFAVKVAKRHLYSRHRRTGPEVLRQLVFGNKVWLTAEQASQLQKLSSTSKTSEFIEKLLSFFREATDKSRPGLSLRSTCRVILDRALKPGASEQLLALSVERASSEKMVEEVNRLFSSISGDAFENIKPLCVEAYKNVNYPSVNGRL